MKHADGQHGRRIMIWVPITVAPTLSTSDASWVSASLKAEGAGRGGWSGFHVRGDLVGQPIRAVSRAGALQLDLSDMDGFHSLSRVMNYRWQCSG
jgi:hypothetical protein